MRASPRPQRQALRFHVRRRCTRDRRSCAFRAGGCASADCAPAPRRGRNDRCRSPAPGGRGSVAVPMPRQRTSRPSKASATPCAGGRRKRLPMRRARDRSGSAGRLVRLHHSARRCRCRASQDRARPAPRPTPPRSRRPCCQRCLRAWHAAIRVPATGAIRPQGNWSCRRRLARPARPSRYASRTSRRGSCGSG